MSQQMAPTTQENAMTLSPNAVLGLQRFGHFNGTVKRNATVLGNLVSAEITYSNNLDRIETIRGDGRIDGADPTKAALSGRIEVRFADSTLVTQAIDGSPCELEFNYSLGANASFTFAAHAVYLPIPRIEIAGPQGVQASFDWQAAKATSPARSIVVTWPRSHVRAANRAAGAERCTNPTANRQDHGLRAQSRWGAVDRCDAAIGPRLPAAAAFRGQPDRQLVTVDHDHDHHRGSTHHQRRHRLASDACRDEPRGIYAALASEIGCRRGFSGRTTLGRMGLLAW